MIVNVDSDDVVYDCIGVFQHRLSKLYDRELDSPTSWKIGESWDISDEDIDFHFATEAKNGLFVFGEPIPGAIDGLYALLEAGHKVRIVTNKGKLGRGIRAGIKDTVQWYANHGLLGEVELVFVNTYEKEHFPADVVIDDKPDLCWTQKGAANILFDRPWNKETGGESRGMWIRAGDWETILELVEIEEEDR